MTKTRPLIGTHEDLLLQDWAGNCYGAVVAWVSTIQESDWFVVHGTVVSAREGRRIDHAWCEQGEVVVDLAMPVTMKIIQREQYYRVLQSEIGKRYSARDAIVLSRRNRHAGPWNEHADT